MEGFAQLSHNNISWYHASKPISKDQRAKLAATFKIEPHHLIGTSNTKIVRTRVAVEKSYTHFILHFPYIPSNSSRTYLSSIHIFITKKSLLTVQSHGTLKPLEDFFTESKKQQLKQTRFKQSPAKLLCELVTFLLEQTNQLIDKQGEKIETLSKDIFKKHHNQKLIETLSVLRYNQVTIHSALERQTKMIEQLTGEKNPFNIVDPHIKQIWKTIIDTFQSLNDEVMVDSDQLEGLVSTMETLLSHRTNQTIKFLTVFSIVLLPLNLITGIFGMNFRYLPLSLHPMGFASIIILMISSLIFMIALVKLRHWV